MIKISTIKPFDRNSTYNTVEDLKIDFLKRLRKYTQPEELLKRFITTGNSRGYKAKKGELPLLKYLLKKFPDVIIGKPKGLVGIIREFERRGWQKKIFNADKTTELGNEILYIFGYSERFRDHINRGIWLAQQLNIKTCPYCNAQSTIVVTTPKQKLIAKLQFDHFFSKNQ